MKKEVAQKIVEENRKIYNRIAGQFSSTRKHPWDDFKLFDRFVSEGDTVLDVGCGNGRLAEYLSEKNIKFSGLDVSEQLINIAKQSHPNHAFVVGEATQLPFPDNSFDAVFIIATLHHIPSQELRTKVIAEAYRVLKPGKHLLMTDWNLWNRKWWPLLLTFIARKLTGRNNLDWGDVKRPWKNQNGEIQGERYLHPFTKFGLTSLLKKNNFKVMKQQYTRRGSRASMLSAFNIVTIARKLEKNDQK